MDLFARATDPNPTLNSYTASARLSATLRGTTATRQTFSGTVYYQRPNRTIDFIGVRGPLSRFVNLVSTMPSYEQAMLRYAITPISDDGKSSSYRLVPRKKGEGVKSLIVTISDASALLKRATWNYSGGGTLSFVQTYAGVGTFRLPAKATISARLPNYRADGTLTFTKYQPNAAIPASGGFKHA
jgi:hypothetical protein